MNQEILTGLALSLSSLRSKESCGVGEFPDLQLLGDFCTNAHLTIIQLLPVNDTGTESSPYSALSAFALHPLYIRLQDIPEAASFTKEIQALRKKFEPLDRFPYTVLCEKKDTLLRAIYSAHTDQIMKSTELTAWIKKNPWIEIYAVFAEQKRLNNKASWKSWEKMKKPSKADITKAWNDEKTKVHHLFFAWVQMRCDQQFSKAASYLVSKNIILKGDIPIMMNEDSADAWAYPEYFNDSLRAGSPPDDMNPLGQNWGFPIYNWDALKKDGYSWWKQRLTQAAKYYKAYRIDHVLGFFRIWAIPETEYSAALGHTLPFAPITTKELENMGFSGDRLRWITKPHVPTNKVECVYNNDYLGTHGLLQTVMDRIGQEELWLFKDTIHGEKDIYASHLPDAVKNVLAEAWRDRLLVEVEKGIYFPSWLWHKTTAWNSFSGDEKQQFQQLIDSKKAQEEQLWGTQAREILGELTGSVDMIACAEDLGSNPKCLEKVLTDLQILGLRVVRWWRDWNKEGSPYIPFEKYSPLSVTTPSVHDSSTVRGWWIDENGAQDFLKAFPPPVTGNIRQGKYTAETARYVLGTMATTKSRLFIPAFQDWLELSNEFYTKSAQDTRINIPGSVSEFNWTYRIEQPLEQIIKNATLIDEIQKIAIRGNK